MNNDPKLLNSYFARLKPVPHTTAPVTSRVPQDLKEALVLADRLTAGNDDQTADAANVIRGLVAELQILLGHNTQSRHDSLVLARVYEQLSSDMWAQSFCGDLAAYRRALLGLMKKGAGHEAKRG